MEGVKIAFLSASLGNQDNSNYLPVFYVQPLVVNLANKRSRHYLHVTMLLELSNNKVLDEVCEGRAKIRDVILTLLSSKTVAEICTLEGKILLRQDIIKRVNVNLVSGKVVKVYWEEFMIK